MEPIKNLSRIDHSIDISVIIVNYRSWKHLQNCLNSLTAIDNDDFTFEVIIVDNNSNDHKLDDFSNSFPQYKFIINSGNNGFSNGNNVGVSHAKGNYFLFLNPDTLVTKDALFQMLNLAQDHSDYGIIACSKVNMEEKPEKEIRFFPKLYTIFGLSRALYQIVNKQNIAEKFNTTKRIIFPDWVSGSIMFMSRKWFDTVNGWNDDYWLYLEDVDLCKRISDEGGKIALTRATNIIHNHGGASRINVKTAALTKAEVIISKHVYISNHFSKSTKVLTHSLLLIFGLLTQFLFAIVGAIFFFIPKLNVQLFLFINLIKYYFNALIKGTWLSKRAPNYAK